MTTRTKGFPMDPNLRQRYEDFLDPDVQRPRLLRAAVFIACFEAFRAALVARGKQFFSDSKGLGPDYQKEIGSLHGSPPKATLLWFKSMSAIDDDDIKKYDNARQRRNDLAHRLLDLLDGGLPTDLDSIFQEMLALLRKIEIWWLREIEFVEEFEGRPVRDEEITPGLELSMHVIHDIALGDFEDARAYLTAWQQRAQAKGT